MRILAEDVAWEGDDNAEKGVLKVTGVIRGSPLSADRLIHIPTFGDYQISAVRHLLLHLIMALILGFLGLLCSPQA